MGLSVPRSSIPLEPTDAAGRDRWLALFHAGDRATLAACYREHCGTVARTIGNLLGADDGETVIHEVFARLLEREDLRRNFQGGSFVAWLSTVTRNLALDYQRRVGRETGDITGTRDEPASSSWEHATNARLLVDRFRQRLPPAWMEVFDLRFLQQLPQREAAQRLSLFRTTLAYRELIIRRQLKRFLLEEDLEP
jgi:RNA polymerase sigma-70 factor (ECF subfamily)